ncbi:MAG: orotidine-5'-phosphate decarboxylase [Thermodesulfobacteriota bacterium]
MTELVVALDYSDANDALKIVRKLRRKVRWFKVGLELFTAQGPDMLRRLKDLDTRIFLDLKLLDIPNTVYGAVKNACDLEADMLTVHILGGGEMLASAIRARDNSRTSTRLMGVTLLTSLDGENLPWPDKRNTRVIVEDLAGKAYVSGLDGVVCSGAELPGLHDKYRGALKLLSPGIRLNAGNDDQKRICTPQNASRSGADYIVAGRPITAADNPEAATDSFLKAIADNKCKGKK